MALQSLNDILRLKDPLKQSQVEFVITETPALRLAKASQKVAGLISGNTALAKGKDLRLRCTSFGYPGSKIEQSTVRINGFIRKRGTIQNKSGTWTCKITEDINGGVSNLIQAWCDLIHNSILGTRLPSALYTGTAQIIMGGKQGIYGKGLKERTIWLQGVYPIEYSIGDINPSSSDPVTITVKFNYDYFSDNSYSLAAQFG